jgi:Carboxypeptidase regulatory-like domain
MGFTSAGLDSGGRTTHFQFSYDESFSPVDGVDRVSQITNIAAQGQVPACEQAFNLMQSWFSGVDLSSAVSLPINIQVADASGGAGWATGGNTITINPGTGTGADFIIYLMVAEVTEMFMEAQNSGWFVQGTNEGSKGEGLSRLLAYRWLELQPDPNFGFEDLPPFSPFYVVWEWLNAAGRPNFVDNNPDDNQPDPTTGCTTCFLFYLSHQLGFSVEQIIAAAAPTLGGVYTKLTGKTDGWQSFSSLVNKFYPPGITYHPISDAIFPVPNLQTLQNIGILSGQTGQSAISLNPWAPAEVVVNLSSDNPASLSVPAQVTVPPGGEGAVINCVAAPVTGPPQTVGIHASYAGETLSATVTIAPRPTVLAGRVTDSSNHPIAQASVYISGSQPVIPGEESGSLDIETDNNGSYQTPDITAQTYQVQISQEGYVPVQRTVVVEEGVPTTTLNVTLASVEPFTVSGTVSAQGGGPLGGVTVTFAGQTATTDNSGHYSFSENSTLYAQYTLTATHAGYMPTTVAFNTPSGQTIAENLTLAALGSLSGTVRDTTGKAIANAFVSAQPAAGGTNQFVSGTSGPNGAYSLTGLYPVVTEVSASAHGDDPLQTQVTIGAGAHVAKDLTLTPGSATLWGTITSGSDSIGYSPLQGATVTVLSGATNASAAGEWGSTHTDTKGSYSFTGMPANSYTVTVSPTSTLLKGARALVQLSPHQVLEEDFVIQPLHAPKPPTLGGKPV